MFERPALLCLAIIASGLLIFAHALVASCNSPPAFSPAQEVRIGETGNDIALCEVEGRATNSFRVFDACMARRGLVDGGADVRSE